MRFGTYYLLPRICGYCNKKTHIIKGTNICKSCFRAKIHESINNSTYTDADLLRDLEECSKYIKEDLDRYYNALEIKK